jgi:hypothetical protein
MSEPSRITDNTENFAATGAHQEMGGSAAARSDGIEQSQAFQRTRDIGPQHHSGAGFFQLRGSFIDGCVDTQLVKCDSRGDTTDAAANNAYILHSKNTFFFRRPFSRADFTHHTPMLIGRN